MGNQTIPIKDTSPLIDVFRRRVLRLFVDRGLLDPHFGRKILSWKHSGFSVDISVHIPASSHKARMNLSQYIVRHPAILTDCLQKILYAPSKGPSCTRRNTMHTGKRTSSSSK
jgi:hypothetical protein